MRHGPTDALLRITGEVELALLTGGSLYSAAMDLSASHHAGDSVVKNIESTRQ